MALPLAPAEFSALEPAFLAALASALGVAPDAAVVTSVAEAPARRRRRLLAAGVEVRARVGNLLVSPRDACAGLDPQAFAAPLGLTAVIKSCEDADAAPAPAPAPAPADGGVGWPELVVAASLAAVATAAGAAACWLRSRPKLATVHAWAPDHIDARFAAAGAAHARVWCEAGEPAPPPPPRSGPEADMDAPAAWNAAAFAGRRFERAVPRRSSLSLVQAYDGPQAASLYARAAPRGGRRGVAGYSAAAALAGARAPSGAAGGRRRPSDAARDKAMLSGSFRSPTAAQSPPPGTKRPAWG